MTARKVSPKELLYFTLLSMKLHCISLLKKPPAGISGCKQDRRFLKPAASDCYRLDKAIYEPLNVSIASSFNCIETFKREIKVIDNAIEKEIKGLNPNAFIILQSMGISRGARRSAPRVHRNPPWDREDTPMIAVVRDTIWRSRQQYEKTQR
ncbi:MAG: hypothetical protein V8S42_06735 [Lachnospiraceae bacterium]